MEKNKITNALDIEGKAERRLEIGDIVKLSDEKNYEGTFTVTEPLCLTQLPDQDELSLVAVVEPNDLAGFIDHFTVLGKQPCLDKDGKEIDLNTITGFDLSIEPHKLELVTIKDA